MIFNSRNAIAAETVEEEEHKVAPIGGTTLNMDVTGHIEDSKVSVPRVGRVFNSKYSNEVKRVFNSRTGNTKMAPFNSKFAEKEFPKGTQEAFTPDNTHFKTHYRLNQGPMKQDYLSRIENTGEEPTTLADEAFGIGQFSGSGPHPSLVGRSLDQFFGIRLRPRVPEDTSITKKRKVQQESLAVNPEFPKINENTPRDPKAPYETTLGHLLQTPSFMVNGQNGEPRTLATVTNAEGNTFDNHPTNKLLKGGIIEKRLYHEAMSRLAQHPDIKVHGGEVDWSPAAHTAVHGEVQKFKRDVHELYHGKGVTLQNGTRIQPLYLSKGTADFITDVNQHFEPHPEDQEKWDQAMTAFGNTTKGTGVRTMRDRAHSPWAQVYDTSFQRRVEDSDDTTLKDVFKDHLGERGQHRYIASAPTSSLPQEVSSWKTALADRMREGTRGIQSSPPTPSVAELSRSPKPSKGRKFSSKVKKFFFNSSNFK